MPNWADYSIMGTYCLSRGFFSHINGLCPETTVRMHCGISAISKMMRIAIAGTNGFAQFLAYYIQSSTPHQFMLLSRRANPELAKKNWQVIQVKYETSQDRQHLSYLFTGVDIVISTIAGPAQLVLVDAAADANVRRFVPSEFYGRPSPRSHNDPTDGGRQEVLRKLQEYELQKRLRFTVFSCGLFYERFGPGGLAASQIDIGKSLGDEGAFLVNMRGGLASIPSRDPTGPFPEESIYISIISARDAARCVVEALAIPEWPRQFSFHSQRLTLEDFVNICQRVRGSPLQWLQYDVSTLRASLNIAQINWQRASGDAARELRAQMTQFSQLIAVAEGVYDLQDTNLNASVTFECEDFEQWLRNAWSGAF